MSNYDYLFGDLRVLRADRQPCIVCGHPTGDCRPEDHPEQIKLFGLGLFPSLDNEQMFTVMEDVYEERQITPLHSGKVLKFKKGQKITLSTARENGLLND